MILTDDQRWDSLGAMPNVRRLLEEHGIVFRNAFVTTPLCCPSRASLLTGQYSRHHKVLSNVPPDGGAPAFDDRSTLATWLDGAGYTTGLFGKYLNRYSLLGPTYLPPGWDDFHTFASEPPDRYYGGYTLNENGRLVHYGTLPSTYSTNVLARKASDFIREVRSPFFLYFAPVAPHQPSISLPTERRGLAPALDRLPASFPEPDRSDKPWNATVPALSAAAAPGLGALKHRMLESLQAVDDAVARIVKVLKDRQVLENTILVFTSDNGFLLGEHGLFEKAWPYEEAIRVPLVVRVPWADPPGFTDDHLVLNIDLAPTLAELAGAQPAIPQDGRSLVPLLHGPSPGGVARPWRTEFVVEYLGSAVGGGPVDYSAIRTDRYMYIRYTNGWRELYDLRRDPFELQNLAHGRMAPLERLLSDRLRRLEEPDSLAPRAGPAERT